jgi:hypothetical protein
MNNDNVSSALEALKIALTEDGTLTANSSVMFKDKIYGKGLFWAGKDYTKQLVLISDPIRIFSSENIDLSKNKHFSINGEKIIDATELGISVTKSNLREVGRLKGLIVDGSMVINNYLHYDANSDRLGIGTDEPNSALSIAEGGIEITLGTENGSSGYVGTFASHNFKIKTDSTTRITIEAGGNVKIEKDAFVSGKLAIGVQHPDSNVDLHVRGAIKFNNKIHLNGDRTPTSGIYNQGDIVWNSKPTQRSFVGWVCVQEGNPGIWAPFGEIK